MSTVHLEYASKFLPHFAAQGLLPVYGYRDTFVSGCGREEMHVQKRSPHFWSERENTSIQTFYFSCYTNRKTLC